MVTLSGIVLPGDKPATCGAVGNGMFVAVNAYEVDTGYFGRSRLYGTGSGGGGEETGSNVGRCKVRGDGAALPHGGASKVSSFGSTTAAKLPQRPWPGVRPLMSHVGPRTFKSCGPGSAFGRHLLATGSSSRRSFQARNNAPWDHDGKRSLRGKLGGSVPLGDHRERPFLAG